MEAGCWFLVGVTLCRHLGCDNDAGRSEDRGSGDTKESYNSGGTASLQGAQFQCCVQHFIKQRRFWGCLRRIRANRIHRTPHINIAVHFRKHLGDALRERVDHIVNLRRLNSKVLKVLLVSSADMALCGAKRHHALAANRAEQCGCLEACGVRGERPVAAPQGSCVDRAATCAHCAAVGPSQSATGTDILVFVWHDQTGGLPCICCHLRMCVEGQSRVKVPDAVAKRGQKQGRSGQGSAAGGAAGAFCSTVFAYLAQQHSGA